MTTGDSTVPGPLCIEPGCDQIGVFPASRPGPGDTQLEGLACFEHSDDLPPSGDVTPSTSTAPTFHVDVTNGLAAMVLEHTAMALIDDDTAATDAMRSLAAASGMDLDVAAGILLATTMMCVAGGIDGDVLMVAAETLEREADEAAIDDADIDAVVALNDADEVVDIILDVVGDDDSDDDGDVTPDGEHEISPGNVPESAAPTEGA